MNISSGPQSGKGLRAAIALVFVATLAGAVWWTTSRGPDFADHDWSAIAAPADPVPAVRAPSALAARNTMAALDPCRLGAAGDRGARQVREDPATCTVYRRGGTITVQTLVAYLDDDRGVDPAINALNTRERTEIDGIAAWVGDGPVGRLVEVDEAACAVVVPVSFELAAAFVGDSRECDLPTRTATAALADLDRMGYAEPVPAACDFLAAGVDGALHQDQATCQGGDVTLILGDSPLDDSLLYGEPVEVAGMAMRVADDGQLCAYEWALDQQIDGQPMRALLRGGPCDELRPLAGRIARAAAPGVPQISLPVFYGADEPDPGGVGDCSQLADQLAWLCAPSETLAISSDPVDVIREGEADPATLCTAALESTAALDRSMLAVTTAPSLQKLTARESYQGPRQCTLIEPIEGRIEGTSTTIMISASREPLETNGDTEVEGHPAYHSAQTGVWEIALTEPTERGFLRIRVVENSPEGRTEPPWAQEFVSDFVQRVWE